ncbi:MAG: acyltransferase [Lachnospiraceae bacterium]|nr:acyltransferase [Lachnospiraceae bacterium]
MGKKRQYNGLDLVKAWLAVLVASRHMIQIFYPAESKWRLVIGAWLSNLAVPVFFITAGFFLFCKVDRQRPGESREAVLKYCKRIVKLYLLWSVIYLPIDYINWVNGGRQDGAAAVLNYLQSFFFCSTTVQLWYLPALVAAVILVWAVYQRGAKVWQILVVGAFLFAVGCISDNWYFNQRLPMGLQKLLGLYFRYFMTVRNGVFYGFFFVALGLWFAKSKREIPLFCSLAGTVAFVMLMLYEVIRCSNTNMVFSSAPAAFCLFAAASSVRWKDRPLYIRLRAASEWVYLSHVYFFHLYAMTARWNPHPATKKGITVSVMIPMLAFAWGMACLSEKNGFRWLKKMI